MTARDTPRPHFATEARHVAFMVAPMLLAPACVAAVIGVVALALGDSMEAGHFGVMSGAALALGMILRVLGAMPQRGITVPSRMMAVAVGWFLTTVVGAIPFFWEGIVSPDTVGGVWADPVAAWYESTSAWTSTGLTVVGRPSQLSGGLQLYRSLAQWLGGLGMTLFVYFVAKPGDDSFDLLKTEISAAVHDEPRTVAMRLVGIYGTLTLFSIGLFYVCGMSGWDALNHGLTGISTGGMSVSDDSFGAYPTAVRAAAIPVMILGAVSFFTYHALVVDRSVMKVLRRTQLRTFFAMLVLGAGAAVLAHLGTAREVSPLDGAFTWVSALTTCGFSTTDVSAYPPAFFAMLGLAMVVGAEGGSTSGGIKAKRFAWLLKGVFGRLQWDALPGRAPVYYFDGELIESDEATRRMQSAGVMASLWLGLIALSSVVLALFIAPDDAGYASILFDCASCLGGVGLGGGYLGADTSDGGQLVAILLMYLGRLEILAVLVLLTSPLRPLLRTRTEEREPA